MVRTTAVEAKREFVEVIVQMLMTDSPHMRSREPALQQGDGQVSDLHFMGRDNRVRITEAVLQQVPDRGIRLSLR